MPEGGVRPPSRTAREPGKPTRSWPRLPSSAPCQPPQAKETPRGASHSVWFYVKPPQQGDVIRNICLPSSSDLVSLPSRWPWPDTCTGHTSPHSPVMRACGRGTFGKCSRQGLASSLHAHGLTEPFKAPGEAGAVSPTSAAQAQQGEGLAQGHTMAEWQGWGSGSSSGRQCLLSGHWV